MYLMRLEKIALMGEYIRKNKYIPKQIKSIFYFCSV